MGVHSKCKRRRRVILYHPQISTRLFVARFQVERDGQLFGEPERQHGERVADGQLPVPGFQAMAGPVRHSAAGDGVDGRWGLGQ